jgi:hypothetical protein
MKSALTIRSFRRSDTREYVKRGVVIEASGEYIDALERIGSVREVSAIANAPENKAVPKKAGGKKQSASPAAPASQQTKSKKSKRGKRKTKRKQ